MYRPWEQRENLGKMRICETRHTIETLPGITADLVRLDDNQYDWIFYELVRSIREEGGHPYSEFYA